MDGKLDDASISLFLSNKRFKTTVNINQQQCYANQCPRHHAITNDKVVDLIKELGKLPAEKLAEAINEKDDQGNTLLHYAAKNLNKVSISFLLGKGANPLLKNRDGKTPLNLVQEYVRDIAKPRMEELPLEEVDLSKNVEKISLLLEACVKRASRVGKNQSATNDLFHDAAGDKLSKLSILKLIGKGADINGTVKNWTEKHDGKNILTYFMTFFLESCTENTLKLKLKFIRNAVKFGADPKELDDRGESAVSIFLEKLPEAQLRAELKAVLFDMNESQQQNLTNELFRYAAGNKFSRLNIIELIDKGADINGTAKDWKEEHNGKNILTYLIISFLEGVDKKEILKRKLSGISNAVQCGANPNQEDSNGNSAKSLIDQEKGKGNTVVANKLLMAIYKGLAKRKSDNEQPGTTVGVNRSSAPQVRSGPSTSLEGIYDISQPSTSCEIGDEYLW